MIANIIALLDGSIYARTVCELAVWVASRTNLSVELLHVLGRREGGERRDLSGAIALGARSALLAELTEVDAERARLSHLHGRAILDDGRAILEAANVPVTVNLRRGDLVEALAEHEAGTAFLILGKRGEASDYAKGHLGSNLERVVRSAKQPVLVAARAFKPIERLLIAYDGGASAMRAVDYVARSPLYAGLSVTVATVATASPAVERGLADARVMLGAGGLKAETVVLSGQPEAALGALVETDGYDMVVMGAYGHSRIRTLVIGSTTSEMIRSCKVPIMLLR